MDWTTIGLVIGGVLVLAAIIIAVRMPRGPQLPESLAEGKPLPSIRAVDENGHDVDSGSLGGAPAVILFVRGNWCPFCTKQVEKLTEHYKEINRLGAKLIFVTPKPLETTRRVAEFFEVEFDFWLDENLHVADELGIRMPNGVPKDALDEYGADTVWPTTIIADADGVIRYAKLSRYLFDRPDPALLVKQLNRIAA